MASGDKVWKATQNGGDMIGYGVAGGLGLPVDDPPPGALEIKRLYIGRAFQSQGLGRAFMDAMLDWAGGQGDRALFLGVFSENFGAQRFYGRYGFERIGEYEFPVGSRRDLLQSHNIGLGAA